MLMKFPSWPLWPLWPLFYSALLRPSECGSTNRYPLFSPGSFLSFFLNTCLISVHIYIYIFLSKYQICKIVHRDVQTLVVYLRCALFVRLVYYEWEWRLNQLTCWNQAKCKESPHINVIHLIFKIFNIFSGFKHGRKLSNKIGGGGGKNDQGC
jgi:hypothetical protein